MHSQISVHNSDRQSKYRSNKEKKERKQPMKGEKASNGEYLVLYTADIYVPEYHHVLGGWFVDISGNSQHKYSG